MKSFLYLIIILFKLPAFADFKDCTSFFPNSLVPKLTIPDKTKELCFTSFAILYSIKSKTPIYGIERLNKANLKNKEKRSNNFYEEMQLGVSERSELSDYNKSGYDRGHIIPAGNQDDEVSMKESFSLANMIPQTPQNNRNTWSKIESDTRKYVKRATGDVYVFTGSYNENNKTVIGKNKVVVPTHIWKLVYDATTKRSWVFWVENKDGVKMTTPISYEEFVKKTGYKLLP